MKSLDKLLQLAYWPALLLAACTMYGCEETNNTVLPPDPAGICATGAPSTVEPNVNPGACDTNTCRASYSVQSPGAIRFIWTFTSGTPNESSNANGEVAFPRPTTFPVTYNYSVKACTCSARLDPSNDSCRSTTGSVIFRSASALTSSDVLGALITLQGSYDYLTRVGVPDAYIETELAALAGETWKAETEAGFAVGDHLGDPWYLAGVFSERLGGSCWEKPCRAGDYQGRYQGRQGC